ncbi:DUF1738 domain-containing protein [Spirosoma aureum]|uniref:DUF1738 domain-containing protein n=1 Tax=Spirosoma aureum TaxID=2692134 RepID=A0A6G9AR32_9BACT|nr:zincin-like metallopeptidase domain-containing protein [Spirosoma aureum]QIP14735.1 DUF1738 domain-containing protein [Spirosoma aureum]
METSNAKRDHFAEVTNKIIASLEKGVVPWYQPWGFVEPAQNHFTGHRYRGINSLLMLMDNYQTPYFGTIKQINDAGGRVKKGSKSTAVYFHDCIYKDKNGARLSEAQATERIKSGDKTVKKYPYLRLYPVFNMADVEGCPIKPSSQFGNEDNQPLAVCQDFLTSLDNGPRILNSPIEGAYFEKVQDYIMMPDLNRFVSSEAYYGVLFHELTHWTGHSSRLNRATVTDALKFGDTNYSKEELIAELGACFLCHHHGINTPETQQNTESYLAHWIAVLKKNSRFLWESASEAQAAYSYLLELTA